VTRIMTGMIMGMVMMYASVDVATLGKQKTRVFQAIKNDFLLKTNNNFGNPEKRLSAIIKAFEADQTRLQNGSATPEEIESLKVISARWDKLKGEFRRPVEGGAYATTFAQELHDGLSVKKKILALSKKQLRSSRSKALFYANNFPAISQKFAITYLLKAVEPAGHPSPETQKQLAITLDKFRTALDHLQSTLNKPEQKAILGKLEKIYRYFDFLSKSRAPTPTLIVHKSNEMFDLGKQLITTL